MKMRRKALKPLNPTWTMLLVREEFPKNMAFYVPYVLAMFGLQGIVVKCTAAILFLMKDFSLLIKSMCKEVKAVAGSKGPKKCSWVIVLYS